MMIMMNLLSLLFSLKLIFVLWLLLLLLLLCLWLYSNLIVLVSLLVFSLLAVAVPAVEIFVAVLLILFLLLLLIMWFFFEIDGNYVLQCLTRTQWLTRTTRQMKIAKSVNTLTISSPVSSSKVIQLKLRTLTKNENLTK